ncbi:MAG: hypothetical protein JWN42_1276 [Candidatus Angelobacter sp.]|nr:hypothetical protein [Candidatus Angelobacter sp.]
MGVNIDNKVWHQWDILFVGTILVNILAAVLPIYA